MVTLKTPEEIKKISASGKILAKAFKKVAKEAKEGYALNYLDKLAYQLIVKEGARPAFLGYRPNGAAHPYQASICASVNNVIVHGYPSNYKLKSGDVLKLDFGVLYNGFYSDAALTVIVGKSNVETKKLVRATKLALERAIKIAQVGNTLGDIGWIIEQTAKKAGFKPVRDLTGHGIGSKLHEEPTVYNYGERKQGMKLRSGMVLAIEPIFSAGSDQTIQEEDESWATADGSLSAHFEHTIAITDKGPKILTK